MQGAPAGRKSTSKVKVQTCRGWPQSKSESSSLSVRCCRRDSCDRPLRQVGEQAGVACWRKLKHTAPATYRSANQVSHQLTHNSTRSNAPAHGACSLLRPLVVRVILWLLWRLHHPALEQLLLNLQITPDQISSAWCMHSASRERSLSSTAAAWQPNELPGWGARCLKPRPSLSHKHAHRLSQQMHGQDAPKRLGSRLWRPAGQIQQCGPPPRR